ncbi:LysM peptidoglycan-binding domain-containing protein [Robertmurraya yapensis]|uniref:LysM peptidoglycan-binding domain-containing protein n=1 Tax=Bacillus yapensis TaxID=2492960 RepID=A0A431W4Q0_9BACI|nr:LysM peptidoglycan-binding domain-containing protein [Bacillus yapensis]RTR30400.1 LysM peptidoglycan-binding domain-containing protein [Bacillus yapensis]TKS95219.1 LysM peptidoglycan-binding domain-containing protein [Bacillus yapensis]
MSKEEPLRDQAQRLRKRISKKSEAHEELITSSATLPPRSRVHQQEQKRKKTRLKLKYPIIRLLAIFFILLPVVSIYIINHNKEKASTESVDHNEQGNIESVNVTDEDEGVSISDSTVIEENVEDVNEEIVAESVAGSEEEANQETEVVESEEMENPASTQTTVNDKNTTPPVTAPETNTASEAVQSHTVQPGENLFRIAMKYYGSQSGIEKIKQANNIQGNEIQVGQTIKIPQ